MVRRLVSIVRADRSLVGTLALVATFTLNGCVAVDPPQSVLPSASSSEADFAGMASFPAVAIRGPFVFHGDFASRERKELIDQLLEMRQAIADRLQLRQFSEPIDIHVFDSTRQYEAFVTRRMAGLLGRRAFFQSDNTGLVVYTYWSERVVEDLRHEVTHACLHASLQDVPLWLDEGIAEYFEVEDGSGWNRRHMVQLAELYREGRWRPNLTLLEQLADGTNIEQVVYAEAWLWVHYMLGDSRRRELLLEYMHDHAGTRTSSSMSQRLVEAGVAHQDLVDHLVQLAGK